MDMRTYLCREAAAVSDASLSSVRSAQDWKRERPERLARYLDSLGLSTYLQQPRPLLNTKVTGVLKRRGFRIEKLYFESLPRLYVTANLYVPEELQGPAPAIAYFCGHAAVQKVYYQPLARRLAQLGFVVLLSETIELGELDGHHHGMWRHGRFHWYSRGYSPAAVECWNGIRALDLLAGRPEVDAGRMGVTGQSGGGATTWWVGAADERARAVALSCSTGTMRSYLAERTVDGHCDCMYHINTDLWDMADVGALIAPRPLLIASADRDSIYRIEAVRETFAKIARIYELLGVRQDVQLVEVHGPHGYAPASRTRIFSWFLKHLAGKEVPPDKVGDINRAEDEEADVLRVFVDGPPADERTATIDEDFIPMPVLAAPASVDSLRARRTEVVSRLRELTFNHFPREGAAEGPSAVRLRPCPPLDVEIHQDLAGEGLSGIMFHFRGEEGWRLPARMTWHDDLRQPRGVLLALRSPRETYMETEGFIRGPERSWAVCVADTRGAGDLSWGDELCWHVRRGAAIIGRTVASMRVFDTLRALRALRALDGVDPDRLALAARGEMVPVALYAALLDGRVRAVIMQDPPATQNAASQPDGRGESIEMLSCLRVTDLAEVAALLWPAELAFVGWRPETYTLAEETYRSLGLPGAVRHIKTLDRWRLKPEDLPSL
jgi:cephalosporin-C deacetylase-like acetyl esterase